MVNWNSNGQRFSFGNLDAAQQTLYEDNPGIAYQKLMEYYGQGNPNFASTTLGRYIAAQQSRLSNSYMSAASQQAADWATQKQAWDANAGQRSAQADAAAAALNAYAGQHYQGPAVDYAGRPLSTGSGPGGQYNSADSMRWTKPAAGPGNLMNDPQYKALYDQWQATQNQQWKAPGDQLTWTKYLESNPAGMGDLANQFNELTANQRGANPGAFSVKRNLW